MFEYLINTTEVYRVDTEKEAAELINNAKQNREYDLAKYSSTKKERKQKGEIIDEWYQVTLVKKFNDEKEPTDHISLCYTTRTNFDGETTIN